MAQANAFDDLIPDKPAASPTTLVAVAGAMFRRFNMERT